MMTIAQSRAARGLLGWTQNDLAKACGLSKTAINNFEKGHSNIKADSLTAIRDALIKAGIEFMDDDGVRKQKERAKLIHATSILLDDLIEAINTNPDTEILLMGFKAGIDVLIPPHDSDTYRSKLKTIQSRTRAVDTDDSVGFIVYGQKVALCMVDASAIIIIESAAITARERARFEEIWALQNSKTKRIRTAAGV